MNKQFLDEATKDNAIKKKVHEQTQLEKLIFQNQETLQMMAGLMEVVSSSNSAYYTPFNVSKMSLR